ncbi:uncharacterized protein BDZ99DRAFT_10423 [Mytilinidion resinicola]|uniref:Cell wall proline rich protein n=1 Tax=Mytilinidion resinicola TaxID=574789 RepID=A0A6A6Z7T6_9PEZI|nr:uncharacterized protein BDZ99DRAFT_10423 [Mytilinidion resinicola]KAF2817171.1 hypothetical protein BDZ99DRAFT_10423 [Mytilinidion resinicola]
MAQIALPRQHVTQPSESDRMGSPLYKRRGASASGPIELIANPDFVFPQPSPADTTDSTTSSRRPMSLQAMPTGRRGSAGGLRQKSVSALPLPDFSFNPSAADQSVATAPITPPISPIATTPTTPSRNIGHRRRGSEFIGGDARSGGVSILSSSPTKAEAVLPPPAALRPGPPAGRRGHAHRRSGAISSHDLSSILQPTDANATTRAGSAPVTPMENEMKPFLSHSVNKSLSQPSLHSSAVEDDVLFQEGSDGPDSSPRRPPSRARVGFSDRVEYIRPLSTISSETESSLSTLRGHSVSNSLSSVVSNGAASPPTARMARPSLNTTFEDDARPSTAGAVLDNKHRNSAFGGDLFSRKRPMSAVVPTSPGSSGSHMTTPRIPAKRRSFFRLDHGRRSDSSLHLETANPASASDASLSADTLESPPASPDRVVDHDEEVESSEKPKGSSRKTQRKPRKVKSWANAIISRKTRHGHKFKNRVPTPPPEPSATVEDEYEDLDFGANFDVDNTVTIVSPPPESVERPRLETDIASWKPREFKRQNSDALSPVIDLDAALGPFNTPIGPNGRGNSRGFSGARRTMHSAGGILQNHRRTESAPELVPFEFRATAIATTSPMADVFEEEEEEDAEMTEVPTPSIDIVTEEVEDELEEPSIGIQVVDTDDVSSGSAINWNFDDGLRIKHENKACPQASVEDVAPTDVSYSREETPVPFERQDSSLAMGADPVEVVEDYEEPRTSSLTRSSDSTITPTMSEDEAKRNRQLHLPLPLTTHQNLMTPDTFTNSSYSSPDFRSSQTSFDTQRLGTASSSITDYRMMNPAHFGEPGPELRVSVDDVPSLTSSRSTMTSALHNTFPLMSPRNPSERTGSMSSIPSDVSERRRKRSSIASLSRLIQGSSFGERSKLSIEHRPQSAHMETTTKDPKVKKHKRLSKMMQFWKPRESSQN